MSDLLLSITAGIGLAWLAIGLWMTVNSPSRGWLADALFVLSWPYHLARHSRGEE